MLHPCKCFRTNRLFIECLITPKIIQTNTHTHIHKGHKHLFPNYDVFHFSRRTTSTKVTQTYHDIMPLASHMPTPLPRRPNRFGSPERLRSLTHGPPQTHRLMRHATHVFQRLRGHMGLRRATHIGTLEASDCRTVFFQFLEMSMN